MTEFVDKIDPEFTVCERALFYIQDKEQAKIINLFFTKKIGFDEIPERYKKDRKFLLELVKNVGLIIEQFEDIYKSDEEIILLAIKNNANVVYLLDEKKLYDIEFIKKILTINPCAITRLPDDVSSNFTILKHVESFIVKYRHIYDKHFQCLENYKRESKIIESISQKTDAKLLPLKNKKI